MSDFASIKQWLKSTEDEPLETMSGFFDRRVDSYEDHMRPWRAYYRWLGELIPAQAETLLDLGCGTGLELDEIFRLHPDIRVTGIDLAPGMLARLREKHPERKLTLTVGDYLTVPLAPCAFDVAVAFETLHHFPPETKLGLFRRIFAALRPGGMLLEGIGDTIRVSLAAEPEKEVEAGYNILRAVGFPVAGPEVITCPTCGRTQYPCTEIANEVEKRLQGYKKSIKVAVMGCVVNGPGEAREADIGIAGGKGEAVLFLHGKPVKKLTGDNILDQFMDEIYKL